MTAEFVAEAAKLAARARTLLDPNGGPEGLRSLEAGVRDAMIGLGASLLERLVADDRGHRGPTVACGKGHQADFVAYRPKHLDTVLGPVRLDRAWYHCGDCHAGLAPRDVELGVAAGSLSPGLRRMVARTAANRPFARARADLAELAGIELTVKRVERAAEADGQQVAAVIATEAAAVAAGTLRPLDGDRAPVDTLYVTLDGTGVPCVPADTDGRDGKQPDGRARTREVKLACVFTQTGVDDTGRPARDPDSSSYVATFAPAETFGTLAYTEARRRGVEGAHRLVVIADGAPWIWNLAALHFPTAIEVVDLYHAREHLYELGQLVAPTLGDNHPGWLADRLAELDRGDINALTAATRDLDPPAANVPAIDKALGYFHTHRQRMRYGDFRASGLFVGSGAVEAGCRAVIGQRLKLSGMRWSVPGATGILTLRCHDASGRWDHLWTRLHHTKAA
ncbi:MAG: ISKra4 family transposase [Egibacteraceae bacterium]